MNQIQHLECEIAEFKIELEKHHNSIRNLNLLALNANDLRGTALNPIYYEIKDLYNPVVF